MSTCEVIVPRLEYLQGNSSKIWVPVGCEAIVKRFEYLWGNSSNSNLIFVEHVKKIGIPAENNFIYYTAPDSSLVCGSWCWLTGDVWQLTVDLLVVCGTLQLTGWWCVAVDSWPAGGVWQLTVDRLAVCGSWCWRGARWQRCFSCPHYYWLLPVCLCSFKNKHRKIQEQFNQGLLCHMPGCVGCCDFTASVRFSHAIFY